MEQIIAFVLGISAGLLAIMLISLYRDMLKMKKETQKTSKDLRDAFERLETIDRETSYRVSEFYDDMRRDLQILSEELSKIERDLKKYVDQLYNSSMERTDEVCKYVDKRIDQTTFSLREYIDNRVNNTVDVLCTRMDVKFEEKPGYCSNPKKSDLDLEPGQILKS